MSEVRYQIVKTPKELRSETGYLGECAIYDHKKQVVYAASPANMVCFMNGGSLYGVSVKYKPT